MLKIIVNNKQKKLPLKKDNINTKIKIVKSNLIVYLVEKIVYSKTNQNLISFINMSYHYKNKEIFHCNKFKIIIFITNKKKKLVVNISYVRCP